MRMNRTLAVALAALAALPSIGTAQMGRSFNDAWFWGVKGGAMDYNSLTTTHQQAPLLGIEWLVTRKKGGLYVSFSQAFFNDQAAVMTNVDASDTTAHLIDLKNMRRLDVAGMIFPGSSLYMHPYAGIGVSIKQINSATPAEAFTSIDQYNAVTSFSNELRTGASPYFIAGSQFRFPFFSFFFQGTASPAQKNMFLYNGKSFHLTYEAGIRYNVGTSIDR